MKTIAPSYASIIIRFGLLVLAALTLTYFILSYIEHELFSHPFQFWVISIPLSFGILFLVWTFFRVLSINVNTEKKKVKFNYFYKTIELSVDDLEGYFRTSSPSSKSENYGVAIETKSHQTIQFLDRDFKSLEALFTFLRDNAIPYKGEKME